MIWKPIPADHLMGMKFEDISLEEHHQNLCKLLDFVSELVHTGRCSIQTRKAEVRNAQTTRSNWDMFWAIYECWPYVHAEFVDRYPDDKMYREFCIIYHQLSKIGPRGTKNVTNKNT